MFLYTRHAGEKVHRRLPDSSCVFLFGCKGSCFHDLLEEIRAKHGGLDVLEQCWKTQDDKVFIDVSHSVAAIQCFKVGLYALFPAQQQCL